MRQNVMIALLSVIATLLAVSVFAPSHPVVGQTASGASSGVVAATGSMMGGSGMAYYLYDTEGKRLAVYFLGNNGLELRAVRDIQWDLKCVDFNGTQGKMPKVSDIRKQIQKGQGKEKGEEKE